MSNDTPVKVKKTADINKYMNDYMKRKYNSDVVKMRMYKNSLASKKKYEIDDATWDKYRENLHHIIKLKKIVDELPNGVFERFLMEYKTLNFKKRILSEDNSNESI